MSPYNSHLQPSTKACIDQEEGPDKSTTYKKAKKAIAAAKKAEKTKNVIHLSGEEGDGKGSGGS